MNHQGWGRCAEVVQLLGINWMDRAEGMRGSGFIGGEDWLILDTYLWLFGSV